MDAPQIILTRPNTIRPAIDLFAIFAVMYFVELTSFQLSIDEEIAAFRADASVWIVQGRWGAFLIETFILSNPVIPFLTPAIFGASCVAAYLLIMDAIDKHQFSLAEYGCFAIFCGFPTWFFIVEFYSNIAAIGIGFFAMTVALWLISKKDAPLLSLRFLCAIAAGGFSISIYQSFAPAILVLGIAIYVLQARAGSGKSLSKHLLRTGILLIGAVLFYEIGNVVFRPFATGSSPYFDSLFQPGFLFQYPLVVIARILNDIKGVYGFHHNTYGAALWAIPPLLALGSLAFFKDSHSPRTRWQLAAVAFVSLLIPFGFHFLAAGSLPIRSLVGAPIAVWLFAYVAATSNSPRIRVSSGILLAVALFQMQIIQNSRQASNYLLDKHDTLLAASIYGRLTTIPGFDAKRTYAISVFGAQPFSTVYTKLPHTTSVGSTVGTTVGYSFFEWDGGNPWRIAYYMKLLGYSNLIGPTPDQVDKTISHLSTMPIWPAPGSVEIKDDIALIRLGETPNWAYQEALARTANR